MTKKERLRTRLLIVLCGFGYLDLNRAIDVMEQAEISAGAMRDYIDQRDLEISDVDLVSVAYGVALDKACAELEELTEKNIADEYNIYIYGNFMCTCYDCESTEDKERLDQFLTENIKRLQHVSHTTDWVVQQLAT